MTLRPRTLLAVVLVAGIAGLAGCVRQGIHPTSAVSPERGAAASLTTPAPGFGSHFLELVPPGGWANFFPLAIGNHWHYHEIVNYYSIQSDGSIHDSLVFRMTIDSRLTGTQSIGGRMYVVQGGSVSTEDGQFAYALPPVLFRQDASGLFEADTPRDGPEFTAGAKTPRALALERFLNRPATAAHRAALAEAVGRIEQKLAATEAGSFHAPPVPGPLFELTRLQYPLRAGAQWVVRDDPEFPIAASFEGVDVRFLPDRRLVGARIRYDSPLYNPADRVRLWYGPEGFLGHEYYAESAAYDSSGHLTVKVVAIDSEWLDGIELVGRRVHP